MKIVACCKVVPDEELIKILPNREISADGVPVKISQYDLNALEAGKKLAAQTGGTVTALSIGPASALEGTKIRKDILSRGANDLSLIIDDNHKYNDSLETAKALAAAVKSIENVDLVLCGTGSSDLYAQIVGTQLGSLLQLPTLNNVTSITVKDSLLEVERTLEDGVEVFEVPLPAVLSVSSEINLPGVPSMQEIMKAGKKPVSVLEADISGVSPSSKVLEELAPEMQDRRQIIVEGDNEEAVDALVTFLRKEAL